MENTVCVNNIENGTAIELIQKLLNGKLGNAEFFNHVQSITQNEISCDFYRAAYSVACTCKT